MNSPKMFGPSQAAIRAMSEQLATIQIAPEAASQTLREAIARWYDVPVGCVAVGNGSTELMASLAYIQASPRGGMLISAPTYRLYEHLAIQFGYVLHSVPLDASFAHDTRALSGGINELTRIIWLDTPQYISGAALRINALQRFLRPSDDAVTVFDNVYGEFQDEDWSDFIRETAYSADANAVVIRTFSKAYALMGIRVGYMVGPERITAKIQSRVLPFSVNALAQVGATAAMKDHDALRRNVELNRLAKNLAYEALNALRLRYYPSENSTLLVRLDRHAEGFEQVCRDRRIKIREQAMCAVPGHIQIHLLDPSTVSRVLDALREYLHGKATP